MAIAAAATGTERQPTLFDRLHTSRPRRRFRQLSGAVGAVVGVAMIVDGSLAVGPLGVLAASECFCRPAAHETLR
jgi:hypothetical protein